MGGYVRPSYQGYGQAGQPVMPYQVSTPAVPGLDAKNSYARNVQQGTAWGDSPILPMDNINNALLEGQLAGPFADPRYDQQGTLSEFWRSRRKSEVDASADYRVTTKGVAQNRGGLVRERPYLQDADIQVDRWTANTSPPLYTMQRPFQQWRARRMTGVHATVGDATYANQGIKVRGGGRTEFRTTQYSRPASRDAQTTTVEVVSPVNILTTGSGLRKWY